MVMVSRGESWWVMVNVDFTLLSGIMMDNDNQEALIINNGRSVVVHGLPFYRKWKAIYLQIKEFYHYGLWDSHGGRPNHYIPGSSHQFFHFFFWIAHLMSHLINQKETCRLFASKRTNMMALRRKVREKKRNNKNPWKAWTWKGKSQGKGKGQQQRSGR